MRKVVLALLVLAALVIGLGFYLNWFSVAVQDGEDQSTISVTVDKKKIKSDLGKVEEKVKDTAEKDKASSGNDNEKTKGSAPTVPTKDKDQ